MAKKEILLNLLHYVSGVMHWVITGLSLDALRWQPDAEANNIAVTVWHIARSFDLLKVRILAGQPMEGELWYSAGWAKQTGYDPQGLGYGGFGNLARYSQTEVAAVPILTAEELQTYLRQSAEALVDHLRNLPAAAFEQPPAWWPASQSSHAPETAYQAAYNFLIDGVEHLGEIKALKAMWLRRNRSA